MFGHQPTLPLDSLLPTPETLVDCNVDTYVTKHQERILKAYEAANSYLRKKATDRQKYMNKDTDDKSLNVGC